MSRGDTQPHAIWYRSLALLRDLGRDEKNRKDVVAALSPIARTARPPVRLATSLALVDLGSDAGREALVQGFQREAGPISSDPPDQMSFPGRFPYDESSITACAHALARLGDPRGLAHPKIEVKLATAEALKDKPDAELRSVLNDLTRELDPKVEKLRVSGELTKTRSPGDYTNRYPEDWVRTRRLLARMGDDASLSLLVEAFFVDAATYPKEEAPLMPMGRVSSWSNGPSPAQAIGGVDAESRALVQRLRRLYEKDARWESASFKALRTSLEDPSRGESKQAAQHKPTEGEITKLLGDSDPNRRAQGLAAAGYHQMNVFYDRVMAVALNGKGVERSAALYSLGFYSREVPEMTLRRFMSSDDEQFRLSALELATRKNPARFARESMEVARALVLASKGEKASNDEHRRGVAYLPRILCRLARGPLPQTLLDGLKDPSADVRRMVIVSLELGGNPDAVRSLEPLLHDPDVGVRKASQTAIQSLGPEER